MLQGKELNFTLGPPYVTNFFHRSCHIRVDLLSYESKTTDKWEQYNWMVETNLDRAMDPLNFFLPSRCIAIYPLLDDTKFTAIYVNNTTGCQINNMDRISLFFKHPSKFFSALQSYCSIISVVLLSYNSRSTLIWLDRKIKFGRVYISIRWRIDSDF